MDKRKTTVSTRRFLLPAAYIGISFGFAFIAQRTTWAFLWPSLSHLAYGLAYALNRPKITMKNPRTGQISPLALALLGPVFLEIWAVWGLRAVIHTKEPVYDEIFRGVYVGRFPFLFGFQVKIEEEVENKHPYQTKKELDHRRSRFPPKVGLIIDVTCEFVEVEALTRGRTYRCIPTLDAMFPPADQDQDFVDLLVECYQWNIEEKGGIYIHCAAGHGRSVMFLCMLMMLKNMASSIDEAYNQVKKVRVLSSCNPIQRIAAARIMPKAQSKIRQLSPPNPQWDNRFGVRSP